MDKRFGVTFNILILHPLGKVDRSHASVWYNMFVQCLS